MNNLATQVVLAAKQLRRALRLSLMHFVFRRLRRLGLRPEIFQTLETFGGTGVNHTPDIYATVAQLDIWDVNPGRRPMLQQKFPRANITIGDSYVAVRQVAKRYDLVVLDAGERMGDRYEHFEMFPYIFRALKPRAVLILNETPRINDPDPERLAACRRERVEGVYGEPERSQNEMVSAHQYLHSVLVCRDFWHQACGSHPSG
jgi:hypothetical protein